MKLCKTQILPQSMYSTVWYMYVSFYISIISWGQEYIPAGGLTFKPAIAHCGGETRRGRLGGNSLTRRRLSNLIDFLYPDMTAEFIQPGAKITWGRFSGSSIDPQALNRLGLCNR
jgi:hypothetical protein